MGRKQKKHKKLVYFDVTGEFFLDIIAQKTDLPDDAELIKLELNPHKPRYMLGIDEHLVRFVVCSDKYEELMEGSMIPQVDVRVKNE